MLSGAGEFYAYIILKCKTLKAELDDFTTDGKQNPRQQQAMPKNEPNIFNPCTIRWRVVPDFGSTAASTTAAIAAYIDIINSASALPPARCRMRRGSQDS